jgi:plastocyanin
VQLIDGLVIEAPARATFTLGAEVVMGFALLAGAQLARSGHYRLHQYWQSSVVLLNVVLIAAIMLPSFWQSVAPQLSSSLGLRYYAVVAAHGALGLLAELLALYVVLAAGTNLLPRRWRFTHFKSWMRATLLLWWLVLLLGMATYYVWYVQSSPIEVTRAGSSRRVVTLTNFRYQPKALSVAVGTTVIWHDLQGTHTVHADHGAFRSSPLTPGQAFRYTFRRPGIYLYHCDFHGAAGGIGMSGRIVVVSRT